MYETFVNRGWRRSGKDLYHPHTFESCCPAISIRLDVWKFGSGGDGTATHHATTTATATTANDQPPSPTPSTNCHRLAVEVRMNKGDDCCTKEEEEEEDAAYTVTTRGSKRQRKVGRAILRALEVYNSKCFGGAHDDEEVNANAVGDKTTKKTQKTNMTGCCLLPRRQHKKSRLHSPERLEEINLPSALSSSSQDQQSLDDQDAAAAAAATADDDGAVPVQSNHATKSQTRRDTPMLFDNDILHPYLESLSQIVYNVVTMEAKNVVMTASVMQADIGMWDTERSAKDTQSLPRWAWWENDNEEEEALPNHAACITTLPKWCSFKLSHSSKDFHGRCHCSTTNGDVGGGHVVTVSTPVCAAVYGISGGMIDKCQLICSVVESLKNLQPSSSSLTTPIDDEVKDRMPRVLDVSVHEKSAHVMITLKVPSSMLVGTAAPAEDEMTSSQSAKPTTTTTTPGSMSATNLRICNLDPISEFLSRQAAITHQLSGTTTTTLIEETHNPHPPRRYLTVRSIPVHESTLQPEVHQLYCQYQNAVHGDVDPFFGCDNAEGETNNNHNTAHEYHSYRRKYNPPGFLDVDTTYGNLDESSRAKIKLSYLAFYRFLGETPVVAHCSTNDSSSPSYHPESDIRIPYGTYHQQYRLSTTKDGFDGPLIAVGVTDILPHCLSSVYAFYDHILSSKLELGKYTALREIDWVRRASRLRPDLHYYYLGEKILGIESVVHDFQSISFLICVNLTNNHCRIRVLHSLLQKDVL